MIKRILLLLTVILFVNSCCKQERKEELLAFEKAYWVLYDNWLRQPKQFWNMEFTENSKKNKNFNSFTSK